MKHTLSQIARYSRATTLREFLTLSALVPITVGAWVGFVWMMAA